MTDYTLYGAESSYYSGKTRSYLLHKHIPFQEKANAYHYLVMLPRKVGVAALPVLRTPQGEWVPDSSVIMDELETRFPTPSALPQTPVLRFAAYLFELWGDEFLLPLAMHTRWNRPEQRDWVIDQFGKQMLPGWPRFLQRIFGGKVARTMNGYRQVLGFNIEMGPVLDRFGKLQLDALDAHFADNRFLFGDRPCYGDYGLIGPLYAHIGRDQLAKRDLMDTRPNLSAWVQRMFQPETSAGGEFRTDDQLPATLMPALRSMIDEMLPFVAACATEVRKTPVLPGDTKTAPRILAQVDYPMAGGTHCRTAMSYTVWQSQRLLRAFRAMTKEDQTTVRHWLRSLGGEAWLELDLPPVRLVGLGAAHVAPGDAN